MILLLTNQMAAKTPKLLLRLLANADRLLEGASLLVLATEFFLAFFAQKAALNIRKGVRPLSTMVTIASQRRRR